MAAQDQEGVVIACHTHTKQEFDAPAAEGKATGKLAQELKIHMGSCLGEVGVATASLTMAFAVWDPEPLQWLGRSAHLLAVSGAFFAGMAEVSAAVWMSSDRSGGRLARAEKLAYAAVVPLAVIIGLAAATVFYA